MKISKFVNHAPKENIFHSNELAKVASGSKLGSTSAETFHGRKAIDHRRKAVKRYGDSMLARGHMRDTARPQIESSNPLRRSDQQSPASRQQSNARPSIPPRTFQEPPSRGHNPYN